MNRALFALLIALPASHFAWAAPVSPAVEKFHKDGIKVTLDHPGVVRAEIGKEAPTPHLVHLVKGQIYTFDLAAGFAGALRIEEHPSGGVLYSSGALKGEFMAPKDAMYRVVALPAAGATGAYTLTITQKPGLVFRDAPGTRL